ncbi:glycine betaine ABC transporter substrate-binding protein [Brucella pituitosa]|uniref:glycine betaine ABC transporter substrate-binding protein n=1 Tax=Brucella pituitosa TaxID=571256 RepID=UPI003F4AE5D2
MAVVRTAVLEANPGIEKPLNELSAKLTNEMMQTLNTQVDVDKRPSKQLRSNF